MAQIHHFDHGWITPTVSYVLSVLGSLLGLTLAVKFRAARSGAERIWWLILAALAIGGTGIWSMHFVAMMGFDVDGTPIRYDVGLTSASAVIAVVAVGLGLAIALLGHAAQNIRVLSGGVIAGLGVAAMHYTGMAAMRLNGDIHYGTTRVGMSIGIAVVAASVALWLAVTVRKPAIIFVSALVMGVAVNGMHFTGMSAMWVNTRPSDGQLLGATAANMLVPIGVAVVFAFIGLGYALMAAPTEEDRAAAAYLAARREGTATSTIPRQPGPSAPHGDQPRASGLAGGSWTYRDRSQ
ncbi:MHYT domain-containing protein [Paractinoplanes rishiriensis]|uniref:Membrane protein n=1 Tax=Paractinoplanes rishiriensis TaxID=1050105 RepID=A0A919K6I5_9ACTN|nr:MHYT domain-containing protein [Actinoplanes rishiriensis]GIF00263.1 membrane protein [Actinoplanes rishiriensis]